MEKLTNDVISTVKVFGGNILNLRQNLLSFETAKDKFKAADLWLNEILEIIKQLHSSPITKDKQMNR